MKKARKLITFILTVVMVLSMSMNVWAVDITITNGASDSEYAAYKLLNATASGDKYAYTLNNDYEAILQAAIKTVSTDEDVTSEEIIPYIQGLAGEGNKDKLREFANAVYAEIKKVEEITPAFEPTATTSTNSFSDLPEGYYLIAETKTGTWDGDDTVDTYSLVMLDTAVADADGTIEIETKEERPTLTKKIIKDDYAEGNEYVDGVVENNLGIGSKVQFELKATIPSDADQYDYYYCIFSDSLSDGLSFITDGEKALKVTDSNGSALVEGDDKNYKLYIGDDAEGNTFQVALLNAKELVGQTITVTYWAELNENAKIGDSTGNTNTAKLTYSNDPNTQYGEENDEKPGKPDDPNADIPMGETPELVTNTYTTGIELFKTDGSNALKGAEFQITGDSMVVALVSGYTFEQSDSGTYYKLANGAYTEEAPTGENDSEYANTETKYVKKSLNKEDMTSTEVDVKAFVDDNGVLKIEGLGQGVYRITETTVPVGYNRAKDIEVKIEWKGGEGDKWTVSYRNVGDAEYNQLTDEDLDNLFDLTVVNNTGSELPSTGGIGTTIFYIVGGALVLFAVVLLVTKKRMKDTQ